MAKQIVKVVVPVTDIWARPAFESSRLSQALYGEWMEVHRARQDHFYVKGRDGYTGWIYGPHAINIDDDRQQYAKSVVKVRVAEIFQTARAKNRIGWLSFGSRIEYDQKLSGMLKLIDIEGWVREKDLRLKKPPKISTRAILGTFKKFLGIPYLWGGKSAFGLDCSGIVQLVFGFHGIALPRDSKDQRKLGKKIGRKNIGECDLIFSPGHVAVYLGKNRIIHASLKAGGVRIESLDKSSPLYREDIDKSIEEIRRIL